jgi:Zn-finger nucleic acid-binding protein
MNTSFALYFLSGGKGERIRIWEVSMPVKPTEREEEYFVRIEQELRQQREEQKKKQASKDEREKLKELHFMKCPKCGTDLIEIAFKGIKIDECSSCRGMWLDAGEFDAVAKIEKPVLEKLFNVFKK